MKSLQTLFSCLCGYCIISCLVGCKRVDPVGLSLEEEHLVSFRLSGFQAEVTPLSVARSGAMAKVANVPSGMGMIALKNVQPSLEPQHLYYWSFNEENLVPDVAVNEDGAKIEFEANNMNTNFAAGFALAPYEAGWALSITGVRWIEVSLPIKDVTSLTSIAFDVSSSGTGPKDFSISYSVDDGLTYEMLSATNQFANMGAQARNSYSFDLSTLSQLMDQKLLRMKLEFSAGDREGAGDYNANSGVIRLDNIRLTGVYDGESGGEDISEPSILQYYVFSQADGSIVEAQQLPLTELSDGILALKLKKGNYKILLLAYHSPVGILLPNGISNANEFYFGQHFDDRRAISYALLLDDFAVGDTDRQEAAVLRRCYSLVEFQFTDQPDDLLAVKKIMLTRIHANYLYVPFGTPGTLPVSDAQSISFGNFSELADYQIKLHQFLGLVGEPRDVSYELSAFAADGSLLNSVTVDKEIPNNVRLLFTGSLLGDVGRTNGFDIGLDSDWDETLESEF
ncbi:hypothetical protein [Olivibacter sitiensis]|uniref:hypothetical protein n=1 Tax=Olivibacter sitiensis TaxID=376470 RepID=UPI0003FC543E|nr:hypothetical protein [Olivibacter sitiensis]